MMEWNVYRGVQYSTVQWRKEWNVYSGVQYSTVEEGVECKQGSTVQWRKELNVCIQGSTFL